MQKEDDTRSPIGVPDEQVVELLASIGQRKISRREVLRRGVALGLTVPAIGWLLTTVGDDDGEASSGP